jgi:hypothetical protein
MTKLVTVYDSAGGFWPLEGKGEGGVLLTYVDGWGGEWEGIHYASNFLWAQAKFPAAWCIQITKGPESFWTGVPVIDCEPGAASPAQACGWANREVIGKRFPTIYVDEALLPEVQQVMADDYTDRKLGIDYGIWLADYNGEPEVPEGCLGHQYRGGSGALYDTSVVLAIAPFLKKGDPLP